MRLAFLPLLALAALVSAADPGVRIVTDLAYRPADEKDEYARVRCRLDLYLPVDAKDFPCVVWFHGGGLEEGGRQGERRWGTSLAQAGIALAAVDYRLSPKAAYPAYIQDAAASVAWVHAHIAEHGGDPRQVFVGGHSAGGYLTAMVTLDKQWLAAAGLDANLLAGAFPVSGQMVTHYTVAKERGIPRTTEVVDQAAPLSHARADALPMLLISGDKDMAGRTDQNRRMHEALVQAGCTVSRYEEFKDRDHGSIRNRMTEADDPARLAFLAFIVRYGKRP
jgi:acetyl esterase/lipase